MASAKAERIKRLATDVDVAILKTFNNASFPYTIQVKPTGVVATALAVTFDSVCCYPRFLGRLVCQTGCDNVKVAHCENAIHVRNAHVPYWNNEFTMLQILGPAKLNIEKIDVERPKLCRFDFLRISGTAVCFSTKDKPILLPKGEHTITWRTDSQVVAEGFHFYVKPLELISSPILPGEPLPSAPETDHEKAVLHKPDTSPPVAVPAAAAAPLTEPLEPQEAQVTPVSREEPISKKVSQPVKPTDVTSASSESLKAVAQTVGGGLTTAVLGGVIASQMAPSKKPSQKNIPFDDTLKKNDYAPQQSGKTKTIVIISVSGGIGVFILGIVAYCWYVLFSQHTVKKNSSFAKISHSSSTMRMLFSLRRAKDQTDPLAMFATSYNYNVEAGHRHVPRLERDR